LRGIFLKGMRGVEKKEGREEEEMGKVLKIP